MANKHIATVRVDGQRGQVTITDINAFVQAPPESEVFVLLENPDGGDAQTRVTKSQLEVQSIVFWE